jgi:hypothetical protein
LTEILRRILAYAGKVLRWEEHLDAVTDSRPSPQIPPAVVMRSAAVMFLSRLGSLNAFEQSADRPFWAKWLGRAAPSADTMGRVADGLDTDGIRQLGHGVYSRLKRNKALKPFANGMLLAVLDGHESHATYRRHCAGCLERTVHTAHGDRIQYYHRHVTLQLVGPTLCLLLDAEPLRPGEGEITAALRLLERALPTYPRAFDLVLGDALYADATVFNAVLSKGKDMMAVLKDERRDLYADALSLFDTMSPVALRQANRQCECWDIEGFTSWPQVTTPVRVVRSIERYTVHRQLTDEDEDLEAHWMWVTTASSKQISTRGIVHFGHLRWTIENEGFNELSTRWHADHVYRHTSEAMLAFLLLMMVCVNVFLAFYRLNLKPARRRAFSMLHVSRLIAAELYQPPGGPPRAPT